MIGRIFTVGGLTLLSRLTGFARDVVLAAVIGAGPVADAFFVALRLPNHFRAIFAEGAFNAAFVPAYARVRQQRGSDRAKLFGDRVFTLLFASQVTLLVIALVFTSTLIRLLAPGFREDPGRFALAVELTRITFPYLLLVSLVTLYGGILNALSRFAAAAAAPILLNLSMMATLAVAAFFPTPGHAAAWGVLLAGILELLLVGGDALRNDVMALLRWPKWDEDVKRFFKALVPATIGSAGVQIALFADTIIASFLSAGALSALYYADRLNQLPIGVIGIAVGTVLLPEMASRIAEGDEEGARRAQARAIELTLLLSIPCVVAFLLIPDLIMRALFVRGAFTAADAEAAGRTLAAYAVGLLPFVLIRSVTATFLARGDTATPVKAALTAVGTQCPVQDPSHAAPGPGRARTRYLDRRLAQSCTRRLVRGPRRLPRSRCALAHQRHPLGCRGGAACAGAVACAGQRCADLARGGTATRCERARNSRGAGSNRLWRHSCPPHG